MIRPYKNDPTVCFVRWYTRRIGTNPEKWFIEWYIPGGKGKRASTVLTGTEAFAKAYEASMRKTRPEANQTNPKIISVTDDFYTYYKTNRLFSTYEDCKKSFKHLLKLIGNHRFTDITPVVIEEYKVRRLDEGIAKRTINKELSYLSSFFKWGVKNKYCHPLPFKIEKFEKVKSPKPEVPSTEVVKKIIDNTEKKYKVLILLLYDCGLRRTEALTLRAENVNLDTRLMIVKGKGEKERIVPIITDRLFLELSKAKKKVSTGYLFLNPRTGAPYKDIRGIIERACEKAKVDMRIYPHLFRHSFGTHATIAGVGLKHLQDVMGHCTSQVTEMYTHLAAECLRDETQKFARYINEREKPKPINNKKKSKPHR